MSMFTLNLYSCHIIGYISCHSTDIRCCILCNLASNYVHIKFMLDALLHLVLFLFFEF